MSSVYEAALASHRSEVLIEGAGIFWLACEAAILIIVSAGRRHLESAPLPGRFALTRREWRWVLGAGIAFGVLTAAVYGRHGVWPPATSYFGGDYALHGISVEAWERVVHLRTYTHLWIWAAFVAGWVLLEAAIVYQGWRGYRRLRAILREAGIA